MKSQTPNIMLKINLLISLVFLLSQPVLSQIPEGYYSGAEGLSGTELTSALHDIIDDHQEQTYDELWNILAESDADTTDEGEFILLYTGRELPVTATYPDWNREHVWAKSHGDFGNTPPAGTDAHHIRPSDVSVNSDRGNLDFDNGGTRHDEATECYYDSDSWEPRDAVKGDVARMIFYMAVRYEGDESDEPDLELKDEIPTSGPWFGKLSTLLEWHNQDPVDDFERNRNDVIYSYQNNRNPFVDHPEYVFKIWGEDQPNTPPVINNIEIHPAYPTDQDAVNITAGIVDETGEIIEAKVCWGLSSSTLMDTITMELQNGHYATKNSIPSQEDSTVIFYQVIAEDDSAAMVKSSVEQFMVNNAVKSIVNENFNSCLPDDWIQFSVSGSNDWNCNSAGYMQINAYNSDNPCSDWLILPKFNPALYAEETLTFLSWTKYYDEQYPQLKVKYSTNYEKGEDPRIANWEVLNYTYPDEDSETWVKSGKVDLSGVNSGQIHIAFHYTSSGTGGGTSTLWKIDSLTITGIHTTNEPPEIGDISRNPTEPSEADSVKISARIKDDKGIDTAGVKWKIEGEEDSSAMHADGEVYTGIIPPMPENNKVIYHISATDYTGVTVKSEEYSYLPSSAITIPQFDTIWFSPKNPESTDALTVFAGIISDVRIKKTMLRWGISPANYTDSVSMTFSDSLWNGTIDPISGADSVFFRIKTVTSWDSSVVSNEFRVDYATPTQLPDNHANNNKFSIYPNPVKNKLKIQSFLTKKTKVRLSLYDVQGNKVFTRQLFFNLMQTQSINFNKIPRGTYTIRLSNEEIILNKKLLVW